MNDYKYTRSHLTIVNVKAVSVNPVDTKVRGGARQGDSDFKAPLILGYDASGVVEAVGSDVTKFKKGDEGACTNRY